MLRLSKFSAYAGNPIEDQDALSYKLAASGRKIIKLNQGNPPAFFPTPKYTVDAYSKALAEGKTGYAFHAGIPELRDAIAGRYNRLYKAGANREDVIVTQGVSEAIFFLNSALIDPSDRALMFRPYYPAYPAYLRVCGGDPIFVDYHEDGGFEFVPERLKEAIKANRGKKIKYIIFSNPCNPTGMVIERKQLKELVEIANNNDIFVISDEIYDEIVYNGAKFTSLCEVSEGVPSAVLGGASKNFDATGFRMGYILMQGKDKFSKLLNEKLRDYAKMRLSSNTPAQYAFTEAINNKKAHYKSAKKMVSQIKNRVNLLHKLINESRYMHATQPNGAFYILPKIDMKELRFKNDKELVRQLLIEEGVQVTPGSGFGASGHMRIVTLAPEDILEQAIRKIDKFLVKHSK